MTADLAAFGRIQRVNVSHEITVMLHANVHPLVLTAKWIC